MDNVRRFFKQSGFTQRLAGWSFEHMIFAMPVKRLKETATLIAFFHPRPSYPVHILIVPKKALAGLQCLGTEDLPFMQDLFATVSELVEEIHLKETGYRLIVNGGEYQDFPQLHFHLVSGNVIPSEKPSVPGAQLGKEKNEK